MRAPLLALLGLLVAATPALAARNGSQPATSQRAKVTAPAQGSGTARPAASRGQAAAPARSGRSQSAAAPSRSSRSSAVASRGRTTHAAAPGRSGGQHAAAGRQGGRYAHAATGRQGARYTHAMHTSTCRGSARNCRIYRVSAPQPMRWSQGLSPALNVQTSNCPAGTMATLATGHTNVVRCMPI